MAYVLDLLSNAHTFIGINGTRTLIDHFLFSDNIIHDVIGYNTIDLIDNLSDHLPLIVLLKCSILHVHALPCIFNARPNWHWTDSKTIKFYKIVLDIKLKEIVFPVHLLSCTNISCDNHIADIENIYSLIVNTCILFRHQLLFNIKRKLQAHETSLRVGIENVIMLEKVH